MKFDNEATIKRIIEGKEIKFDNEATIKKKKWKNNKREKKEKNRWTG